MCRYFEKWSKFLTKVYDLNFDLDYSGSQIQNYKIE